MSNSAQNIQSLFAGALQGGAIDPAAAAVVVPNMTANIQAAMGVSVDDVMASSVVLLNLVIDDSSSIEHARNTQIMIDGVNLITDAVGEVGPDGKPRAKEADGILCHARFLNRGILYPFIPLTQITRLTGQNYCPDGYTPLYDTVAETIAAVVAKTEEFAQNGVPCRSITMIVTDGADVGSTNHRRPESIKPLVDAALRSEQHIIGAMGIDDGSTPFRDIFGRMGLRDKWILTPKNTTHEIRQAFTLFSRSAVRGSQAANGAAFSQVAAGGFASP